VRGPRLYSSPLWREREDRRRSRRAPARARVEPALAEYGIGELEGVSYWRSRRAPFFEKIAADPDFARAAGESPRQVVARVSAALAGDRGRAPRANRFVVVSHGATLGLALGSLIERDANQWQRFHLANCGVSESCSSPSALLYGTPPDTSSGLFIRPFAGRWLHARNEFGDAGACAARCARAHEPTALGRGRAHVHDTS